MAMPQPDDRPRHDARRQLSPEDWARAALATVADGGLAAVAVERLAAELGTTKGSFYWHFRNREALLLAALELWEHEHTEVLITTMEAEQDPARRLRRLFTLITEEHPANRIEVALLATAGDPHVAAAIARVTQRRVDYVAEMFTEMGWTPARARRQALLAYTAWLGFTQLVHSAPATVPTGREQARYISHVLDTLVGDGPA